MKNKVCLIIFLAILLIGIGLIAYPSFSDFINRQFAYQTITEYRDVVGQKDIEEMKAEIERAQNYNRILAKQQNETGLGIPSAEGISEMSEEGKCWDTLRLRALISIVRYILEYLRR